MAVDHPRGPDQPEDQVPEEADVDGEVLPDRPIRKTSNPYQDYATFLCPHCTRDITPVVGELSSPDWEGREVPGEVHRHIRACGGLKPYFVHLIAARQSKRKWLGMHQAGTLYDN